MTIAISLPDDFDIENYTGLQAFLIEHLELSTGTQAQLASLIRLAELRLTRIIDAPGGETTGTLVTVAGTQTVTLPSDFRKMRQVRVTGTAGYPLDLVAPHVVEAYDTAGKPVIYAIHGDTMILGPIPDAVYTLGLRYQAKLSALTDNSQSNWLLANHADAYVYMAAAVINLHLENKEAADLYLGMANAVADEVNAEGVRHNNSGPMRPMVVTVP